MTPTRRTTLAGLAATAALTPQLPRLAFGQDKPQPIIFVHGNGDTAGLWITTLWRFESNGYPRDLMHAIDLKYPQARAVEAVPQPGRSSNNEVALQVAALVTAVKAKTGAGKVVLVAQSRGGNTVRNYIKNHGGAAHVSLAILCGAVNHGVIISDKALVGSEFNGASAFMKDLNSTPGEVVAGVRFVTIRSLDNDKFAQPDGRHLGMPGVPTGLGFDAPELKGAENIVIPKLDHRETGYAPEAFAAMYQAVTGRAAAVMAIAAEAAPVLNGTVSSFEAGAPNNIGVTGATVTVFRVDSATGARMGDAVHMKVTDADGTWGPFTAANDAFYEFVVDIPGQTITHIYRQPFPRSSAVLHLRPHVLAKDDAERVAVVYLSRPRGYFGVGRDTIEMMGLPVAITAGVPTTSITKVSFKNDSLQVITGRFNDERITARIWPIKDNRVSVIELTF